MNFKNYLSVFVVTVVLCVTNCFCAPNYTEMFLQANDLYKKNEYKKAYDLYKSIPDRVAKVNYNLGNCAYKLGDYGKALLYWRKAERDWNSFDRLELLENIELVKSKLNNNYYAKGGKFFEYLSKFKNYLFSLVRATPLFLVQFLFLLLWFLLFLYIKYLYKKKQKFLIILLFILVTISGVLLVVRYSVYYKRLGIVVSKKALLMSGPGNNFQQLGNLPEGSEVLIQQESDNFYKIKFYRQIGWVNQKDVGKV